MSYSFRLSASNDVPQLAFRPPNLKVVFNTFTNCASFNPPSNLDIYGFLGNILPNVNLKLIKLTLLFLES